MSRQKRADRKRRSAQAEQARRWNTAHTYIATVTGHDDGQALVRITSAKRGADVTLVGATIAVHTDERFPVWSAVRVRLRAGDRSLIGIGPVK